MNQNILEGKWHAIKSRLHDRWSQVTEADLERARGNLDQLVGTIHWKTGVPREDVERWLENTAAAIGPQLQSAGQRAAEYAQRASQQFQGNAQQALEASRVGLERAQRALQQRPLESVAASLGIGVAAGLLLGLVMRSK